MLPALVLTAGLGTRLDPLTRLVAKAAVPLGGSTLIERVLDWLRREGVRDVVLNLHHLPHTITSVVGDGAHLGMRVRYSWEQPVLGSAGGPRRALPLLDAETFFIVNGDTLCDFSLTPMLDAHRRHGADVTLALVANPDPHHYNGLMLDGDDRVTGWLPKGRATGSWHFIGVQIAHARVFAGLPDGVPAESMSGLYQDLLKHPGRLRGFRPASPERSRRDTPFLDVGTPRDYLEAAIALEGVRPMAQRPKAPGARTIVWPGATVAESATLEDCVVAGDVTVPAGFEARESVLVPAALVRPGDAAEIRRGVGVFPFVRSPR
ncbi:MAG TPA: sugar phosphate nucleotidyltransferase [Vicinamibacterales bacterium]|nr:sugar phosphate nucleotidyltransferase [Vicinamibacterales bacterium]